MYKVQGGAPKIILALLDEKNNDDIWRKPYLVMQILRKTHHFPEQLQAPLCKYFYILEHILGCSIFGVPNFLQKKSLKISNVPPPLPQEPQILFSKFLRFRFSYEESW